MKNFIYLNYNIYVDKIYTDNKNKFFILNNEKIYILKVKNSIDQINKLYEISNDLQRIKVDTFILNNERKCCTIHNKDIIVLLKENDYEDINLNELKKFWDINTSLEIFNVIDFWKDEINTIEKELIEYNKEFLNIQYSVDYFIGCAENAIQLLSTTNYKSINHNSIGHTVDYMFFKTYGLNNPFGFIKINRVYDLSNYIKYKFFINKINYDELDLILSFLSIDEKIFLFSCLLYPNIYFDLIKHILLNEEKEKKVLLFIKRIKSYKRLLQYIKNEIKDVKDISFINWLNT